MWRIFSYSNGRIWHDGLWTSRMDNILLISSTKNMTKHIQRVKEIENPQVIKREITWYNSHKKTRCYE